VRHRHSIFALDNRLRTSEIARIHTRDDIGSIPLDTGRQVVRSVDVTDDGTVFVTCQAGEHKARWDGDIRLTSRTTLALSTP